MQYLHIPVDFGKFGEARFILVFIVMHPYDLEDFDFRLAHACYRLKKDKAVKFLISENRTSHRCRSSNAHGCQGSGADECHG